MNKEKIVNYVKSNTLLIGAIIMMLIPVLIACSFVMPSHKFLFIEWGKSRALLPDEPSVFMAILLYAGSVIRGDWSVFKKPTRIILMILNLLFIASFTKCFINTDKWKLFGVIPMDISSLAFFIFTLCLSWLGMKTIAGFAWIILLLASIGTLQEVSIYLGFSGAVYILCAFLSVGFQLAGGLISIDFENLKMEFLSSSKMIKSDTNASIDATKKGVKSVIGVAKMAAGVPNIPKVEQTNKD